MNLARVSLKKRDYRDIVLKSRKGRKPT